MCPTLHPCVTHSKIHTIQSRQRCKLIVDFLSNKKKMLQQKAFERTQLVCLFCLHLGIMEMEPKSSHPLGELLDCTLIFDRIQLSASLVVVTFKYPSFYQIFVKCLFWQKSIEAQVYMYEYDYSILVLPGLELIKYLESLITLISALWLKSKILHAGIV